MTDIEKKICDEILKDGDLLEKTDAISKDGIFIEYYELSYLGEKYLMTKHNGEWIYFHHEI